MKFFKLNQENHVYMTHEQKPIQQTGSKYSKSPKTLNLFDSKILKNFTKNA